MPLAVTIDFVTNPVGAGNVTAVAATGTTDTDTNPVTVTFTDSAGTTVSVSATVTPVLATWAVSAVNLSTLLDGPVSVVASTTNGTDHVHDALALILDAHIANGYCTVAQLRAAIGDSTSLQTTTLQTAIQVASRQVDTMCERYFYQDPGVTTFTYDPDDYWTVSTDDISTTAGLVVKIDSSYNGSYATTWTLGTNFVTLPEGGIVAGVPWPIIGFRIVDAGSYFPPGYAFYHRTVQVTARFGWASVPDAVNLATLLLAVANYKAPEAPGGLLMGDFGVVRQKADPRVEALLGPYKANAVAVG
jgi:hypothetical protein